MADNFQVRPGSGSDPYLRLIDRSGIYTQVMQLCLGGAGAEALLTAGQKTMAASLPVVIASNQSAIPISAASLPLPADAATETTLSGLNSKVTACNTGAVVISSALPAGTNAIGKLAANSGVDIGDVDVPALNVNLNTLHAGDVILIGTTGYTVKQAKIDRATSGELVAAVTGKKIRVIALYATVAADTTVTLKSATTTTGVFTTTGAMTIKAGGGMVLPRDPDGHVETTSGEGLNVTLGTACQISGMLKYVEV